MCLVGLCDEPEVPTTPRPARRFTSRLQARAPPLIAAEMTAWWSCNARELDSAYADTPSDDAFGRIVP